MLCHNHDEASHMPRDKVVRIWIKQIYFAAHDPVDEGLPMRKLPFISVVMMAIVWLTIFVMTAVSALIG